MDAIKAFKEKYKDKSFEDCMFDAFGGGTDEERKNFKDGLDRIVQPVDPKKLKRINRQAKKLK